MDPERNAPNGGTHDKPVCADVIAPYTWAPPMFAALKRGRGNKGRKNAPVYKDVVTAFDIETSTLQSITQSIMYVWQWQIGTICTVMGRTWKEFVDFARVLCSQCKDNEYFVVYVHNLSFEFQFLRGIYPFQQHEVFALERRKVLKCTMFDHLELRCSYLHSNMSLEMYTEKMGVFHVKQIGDLDYTVLRWPYTPLTGKEIGYCVNDVRGLVEAIMVEMEHDGDNLYTIPLTSTGYVRRDTKKAVRQERRQLAQQCAPTPELYRLLREAFRGGNTHANRYFAGKILENVKSFDRSSSYPDVLCNCKFPITEFLPEPDPSAERVRELVWKRGKACLFRAVLHGVKLSDPYWGCPYIPKDKCRRIIDGVYDNGRVLEAEYLEISLTDVDWRIILDEYTFTDVAVCDLYSARYGYLPRPIIETNIKYYQLKTELKGVDGMELLYLKSKNKLNSIYGMMAQNPVREQVEFVNDDYTVRPVDLDNDLAEANRKAFLAYQWGVWCTAWARYRLEEGIKIAGDGFVYCDTDSVKFVGNADFTEYNKLRIADSIACGSFAKNPKGDTYYMGVYENEGTYEKFSTLGAKKYCYVKNGKLTATIAGVSKRNGGPELERAGGIEAFREGFTFHAAGGTESIYNDNPDMCITMPNGEELEITSNVVIRDSTYTLGVTAEYRRLLDFYLDYHNPFDFDRDA